MNAMKQSLATAAVLVLALAGAAHAKGDPAAGQRKSQVCVACHGVDGNSENPIYPRLAGQYEDYLLRAMLDYKSGARQNPIMAGMVAGLSEQDMQDLAAYFAAQRGLVDTPPR